MSEKSDQIEKVDDELNATLDDIISSAINGDEAEDVADAPEADAPKVGRDEKGRFAKKEQEPSEEEAAPAEATASEEAPVVERTDDQTKEADPAKPKWSDGQFRGWSPEQRAKFETLAPEQQEAVMAYKAEYDASFTKRDQEFSHLRKEAEPLIELSKANADLWAAQNLTPAQALSGYANIERTLTYGSYDQKVQLIGDICKAYSIPFDASLMTLDVDVDQYRRSHDSQSEIARIQAENARLQRQFDEMRAQSLQGQIEAFASATDPSGAPKHPHFETVKAAMGGLLNAGAAKTLEEAYEIASKPIADAIAAREAEIRATTQAQQRSSVEKAKKAAPVKPSPSVPGGKATKSSLDDVIADAMAKAGW